MKGPQPVAFVIQAWHENQYKYFFFFKQKTAYEMLRSLVGSEMCIRDSYTSGTASVARAGRISEHPAAGQRHAAAIADHEVICLLYTSDAADDLLCVDLGGRRIIKKKNKKITLIITF